MSGTSSTSIADACGIVTGGVTASQCVATFDPSLDAARATWTAGDFGRIAVGYASGATDFVKRLRLCPGDLVLDVACGTGNLAIPAAADGAVVTGVDVAPNLVEAARRAAAAASLDIRFDVGAAEALPYPDGSFDAVISMFGVMFAARPEMALAELLRVARRGGHIALASWTPGGFIGAMLRAHTAQVSRPAGAPSPLAWGDETTMRQRLDAHAGRIRAVQMVPRTLDFTYPLTPAGVVELFREFYGPSVRTFGALDAQGRARLSAALLDLWRERNTAPSGSTSVAAEYPRGADRHRVKAAQARTIPAPVEPSDRRSR